MKKLLYTEQIFKYWYNCYFFKNQNFDELLQYLSSASLKLYFLTLDKSHFHLFIEKKNSCTDDYAFKKTQLRYKKITRVKPTACQLTL